MPSNDQLTSTSLASKQHQSMAQSSTLSLYVYADWRVSSIVENVMLKINKNTIYMSCGCVVEDDEHRPERKDW